MSDYRLYSSKDCQNQYGIPDELIAAIKGPVSMMNIFLDDNADGQVACRTILGFVQSHIIGQYQPSKLDDRAEGLRQALLRKGLGDHADEQVEAYRQSQEEAMHCAHYILAVVEVINDSIKWMDDMELAARATEKLKPDLSGDWRSIVDEIFPEDSMKEIAQKLSEMLVRKGFVK